MPFTVEPEVGRLRRVMMHRPRLEHSPAELHPPVATLGLPMGPVGWAERQVRYADRFQQRHAMLGFPLAVIQKFGNDQAGSKATLIAYYSFFALFAPLLLCAAVLSMLLPHQPALRDHLVNSALRNFPVISDQLRSQVHPLEGGVTALMIGIAGTLYGAIGLGLSAQNAMNTVWSIPFVHWPGFWRRFVRTIGYITLLGPPAVITTLFTARAIAMPGGLDSAAAMAIIVVSAGINCGTFLLAFMLLTAQPLRISDVAPGALCATPSWEILQLTGTWYIGRELHHTSAAYGYFAIIVTLLSWLFLGAQLLLWTAEINVVLRCRLWPRSVIQPPLTIADRLVFQRLVQAEIRRPEIQAGAFFSPDADSDPLR